MVKKFSKRSGFTLIELLVVIAIIGILSSIVLASLNTARSKGNDAAVKSGLDNMRPQAELWYDSNGQVYTGVCGAAAGNGVNSVAAAGAGVATASTGDPANFQANVAGGAGKVTCNAQPNGWAVEAPLKTDPTKFWCIDSTGQSKQENASSLTTNTTIVCI